MNPRTPLMILLLAVVAALSYWLGREPAKETAVADAAAGPDLFIDRFTTLVTDAAGHPVYRIAGERMERLRADGHSEVTAPAVIFAGDGDDSPWTLVAAKAWISHDNEEVRLADGVVIDRPATRKSAAARLATPYLTVLPVRREVKTDAPVILTSGAQRLAAVGMYADLRARTVEFLAEVRTVYVR